MGTGKKAELLAPAGDLTRLEIAVLYGADAVYIGGEEFSMRTACDNFSNEDIKRGIDFAKMHGKKVYVAANVIMREYDMERLSAFATSVYEMGADGMIVSDLGAFSVIRQATPHLPIHVSTQANITNVETAKVWHDLGAQRVVLARELSREEVYAFCKKKPTTLEVEMFVHGAMCVSYSGRCLLSNYMAARDANRGDCAQACRWKYALMEEKRPGMYMPIVENDRGSYVFNAKDLCLLDCLPEILDAGVVSLKIEGRVKSEYYVATVVKAYRQALDRYYENPKAYKTDPMLLEEVCKVSHRHYCHGFWDGDAEKNGQIYESATYIRTHQVVGIVKACDTDGYVKITQRNKFSTGDTIEFLPPQGQPISHKIEKMYDENGMEIQSAPHPTMTVCIKLSQKVPAFSMVRQKIQHKI